jgi:hypothetical protein
MLCARVFPLLLGAKELVFIPQSNALRSMKNRPPRTKREHLRQLVEGKQLWSEPLSAEDEAKGFLGWHERGYLPHCDKPGLTQFVTFRLADSMPESRRGEWEHLLAVSTRSDAPSESKHTRSDAPHSGAQSIALREEREMAAREQRIKLEAYLDRGLGECHLRDPKHCGLGRESRAPSSRPALQCPRVGRDAESRACVGRDLADAVGEGFAELEIHHCGGGEQNPPARRNILAAGVLGPFHARRSASAEGDSLHREQSCESQFVPDARSMAVWERPISR